MRKTVGLFLSLAFVFLFNVIAQAQADEFCGEFGVMPSLDSPFAAVPYVFGRISLKGYNAGDKFPSVTIVLVDRQQTEKRITVDKSGKYCFKRTGGSGGTLLVEVDGVEAARRPVPSFSAAQVREDFEIFPQHLQKTAPPATVSAKFSHPQNDKTIEIYKKAAEAEQNKDRQAAIRHLKELVKIDPSDFIAWAKLGSLHFEHNSLGEAEAAFRRSIELKLEYTPAWINVGKIRVAQKQFEAAVEILKHATSLDPKSGRAFQLLGEAYLQSKQGTLAVQALNESLRLDPAGMADSHLLLARLYDAAGARHLAAAEFKAFLSKVNDYPERKKLEKYIKDNPQANDKQ